MVNFRAIAVLLVAFTLGLAGCRNAGEFGNEPEQLVGHARVSFQGMVSDNQYPGLVDLMTRAKAVIIAPNMVRIGFFFGGRSGNAIMLVRGEDGKWSEPAFYNLSGLSFGLQFGGKASELVLAVMTEKGLNAILDRKVTLGGDAGIAVGELGKGVHAATGIGLKSDVYAFARSEGLFAGVSVEGTMIYPRHVWNEHMYGAGVKPRNILIDRSSHSDSPAIKEIIAVMP